MNHGKHHAVLFEGDRSAGLEAAYAYVEETLALTVARNPDVSLELHDRVTLEMACTLKVRAAQQPFGKAQAFIIGCETILVEAQNALLKLLEEPTPDTHFIFVIQSADSLLPTVRSRMYYAGRVERDVETWEEAESFLAATPVERSRYLAPILKDKDRTRAQDFVRLLERYFYARGVRANAHALAEIAFVERYLNNRGSSLKLLLEHLAAVL